MLLLIATTGCVNIAKNNSKTPKESTDEARNDSVKIRETDNSKRLKEFSNSGNNSKVVENWKIFSEKDFDFSFEYPDNWTYSRNNMGRIIFLSEIGEEFVIDFPIKDAQEMWPAKSDYFSFKTNYPNTDLYYEHRDTDVKISDYNLGIIKWQKGVHGENIYPGFMNNSRDNSFLVSFSYSKDDADFYKIIIDKFIKSFKFTE